MPSLPLGSKLVRKTVEGLCHLAFCEHTRLDDVGRGMPLSPLDSKHGRTMSGVACHHCLWEAQPVGRHRALHAIIAFGQNTQSNDVGHGMPSSPLGSTHGQTTSGVACPHLLWGAHRIVRCRALHAIIAFGLHTRSNDVGCGTTSPPLENTLDRQRRAWLDDITALGQHTRSATSGVA